MGNRGFCVLLVVLAGVLASAPARADGYLTARGLYDDCSAGAAPGFDLERIELRRKCQNFILAVANDWLGAFPVDRLPMEPTPCPREALVTWQADHAELDPKIKQEVEQMMREALGDEVYERVQRLGSASDFGPHIVSLADSGPAPFVKYWDARGFGLLGGLTLSARSAVLEFLDARMVICSRNQFASPVDPKTLPRSP